MLLLLEINFLHLILPVALLLAGWPPPLPRTHPFHRGEGGWCYDHDHGRGGGGGPGTWNIYIIYIVKLKHDYNTIDLRIYLHWAWHRCFSFTNPAGARARRGFWLTLFGGCGPQIVLKNPPFSGANKAVSLLVFGVWEINCRKYHNGRYGHTHANCVKHSINMSGDILFFFSAPYYATSTAPFPFFKIQCVKLTLSSGWP